MVMGTPPGVPGDRGEEPGERVDSEGKGEREGGGGGLSFENRF